MHGQGEYLDTFGNVYKGEFNQGKFQGEGVMHYANGDVYEGEFAVGKREGKGLCVDVDGNEYEGQWKENRRNGEGVLKDALDGVYRGMYKDGVRDGWGTYTWPDGTKDMICCKEDHRVGKGVGWSKDRKRAWSLLDGRIHHEISVEEGAKFAQEIGFVVSD